MTERIDIQLSERSYPVWIGLDLLRQPTLWPNLLSGRDVLILSDDQVAPLYAERLIAALPADRNIHRHIIAAGESSKNLDTCTAVFATLADMQARRDATIIALGGGVVGDLAGFAAACWMRGIGFVQVPTTLLAMVDSSVGGKTGVNLPHGKNLVGAFHQPRAVLADTGTLTTLPDRELAAGLAEVVKYAAIADHEFMDWLEDNAGRLLARDMAALGHAITISVRHKAAIVGRDEHERGERALLNFGHTFGHAIEAATSYARYLHGEAVAIGMVQAARLSSRLGLAASADADRLAELLKHLGLPTRTESNLDADDLLHHMRLDKKATGAGMRFILWHGAGRSLVADGITETDLLAVLREN